MFPVSFIFHVQFCVFAQVLPTLSVLLRNLSDASTDLKSVLEKKIPAEQERVKTFRKEYGNKVVGDVTVDMVSKINSTP